MALRGWLRAFYRRRRHEHARPAPPAERFDPSPQAGANPEEEQPEEKHIPGPPVTKHIPGPERTKSRKGRVTLWDGRPKAS